MCYPSQNSLTHGVASEAMLTVLGALDLGTDRGRRLTLTVLTPVLVSLETVPERKKHNWLFS